MMPPSSPSPGAAVRFWGWGWAGEGGLEAHLISCEELLVAIGADQQNPPERCGAG